MTYSYARLRSDRLRKLDGDYAIGLLLQTCFRQLEAFS